MSIFSNAKPPFGTRQALVDSIAATRRNTLSCDPAASGLSEKCNDLCNLLWSPDPVLDWCFCLLLVHEFLIDLCKHIRLDGSYEQPSAYLTAKQILTDAYLGSQHSQSSHRRQVPQPNFA